MPFYQYAKAPDFEECAKEAAGNHERFESFAWGAAPDDAENWTIVYTSNRDSTLLDQSNAAAIAREMEPFLGDDCRAESHGHWAVGYVDGYAIRVYRADGEITEAFKKWCEIQEALECYPVLDESDYSDREHEATLKNIESAGRSFVSADAPDGWASEVFGWFWDNDQNAVESHDDQGGYPSDEQIKRALAALGYLDKEGE